MPTYKKKQKTSSKANAKSGEDKDSDVSHKISLVVKDLDVQFDKTVDKLKDDLASRLKEMRNAYNLAMYHIPPHLKEMLMPDLLALVEKEAKEAEATEKVEVKAPPLVAKRPSSTLKKKLVPRSNSCNSASKRQSRVSLGTAKKSGRLPRATSMKQLSSRKLSRNPSRDNLMEEFNQSINEDVFYTPQSVNKRITTVTPKVDLSKPLPRSAMRRPRAGEVFLSLSGSPIYINPIQGFSAEKVNNLEKAKRLLQKRS